MKFKKFLVVLAVIFTFAFAFKVTQNTSILTTNAENPSVSVSAGVKNDLTLSAKSSFCMEYDTETVIHSHNENTRLPIASMCKIMTLLLCFEEIEKGNLTLEEEVLVSEKSASMGGSQVFLEANANYQVKELLKSIAVCSANDSCVAMAERIAGEESFFTDKMNEKAKELGANDTLFANCTGLPQEPQYSTAKDVAIILKALLKHEGYYEISRVWMDNFKHPKGRVTEISNTNKLVRFYDGCDGGKTGFTNQAGYCLAATANRNGMRIISVVIGEKDSKTRFNDIKNTFDYAFSNYSMQIAVDGNNPIEEKASVVNGKQKLVLVKPSRSSKILVKRGEKSEYTTTTHLKENLKAPLKVGTIVGELVVYKNGIEIDKIDLISNESIEKANFFDQFKEISKNWTLKPKK